MRRVLVWVCVLVAALSGAARAEQGREQTLADIRQELSVLYVEVQKLKRELSTTGAASAPTVDASVLDRVSAIERELERLTNATEKLQFRIARIVRDGTNRIGDLEFRLCELESGCDIARLKQGTTLGGEVAPADTAQTPATPPADDKAGDMQLAVGERADFEAADKALKAGDFAAAAEQFARFRETYPGSPLEAQAGLKRGQALEASGATTKAARAYLDTFSADPDGPQAPEALYRLGRALGELNQISEACTTLAEVGRRFPGGQPADDARAQMQSLGCQ